MTKTKTITETYRNPKSFAENGLRYFVNRDGQHVVVHDMNVGEEIEALCHPTKRFERIEDARAEWKRLRNLIASRGYTERCK